MAGRICINIKSVDIRFRDVLKMYKRFRQQIAAGISLLAILAYLIIDSLDTLERLQSISGIFVFFLIGYLCSAHRNRVQMIGR